MFKNSINAVANMAASLQTNKAKPNSKNSSPMQQINAFNNSASPALPKNVSKLISPLINQLKNTQNQTSSNQAGSQSNTTTGTSGNDRLVGTNGDDQIAGLGGDDDLYGLKGNDRLYGGSGRDRLYGGIGDDHLHGESGDDRLYGDVGNDYLNGGEGKDKLYGGSGDDALYGGAGNDRLSGSSGKDSLFGDEGDDKLYGGSGDDTLDGGSGKDRLSGGSGDDDLQGKEGNDKLYGGSGNDRLDGGSENDRLYGGNGNDYLIGGVGDDRLYGGNGDDYLLGGALSASAPQGNNYLDGGQGNDTTSMVGNLSDYRIEKNGNTFTLTNEQNGNVTKAINIEKFIFGSKTLSEGQLSSLAENYSQLSLTSGQQQALEESITNNYHSPILLDADNSGDISEGDVVLGAQFGELYELSQADADSLLNISPTDSNVVLQQVENIVNDWYRTDYTDNGFSTQDFVLSPDGQHAFYTASLNNSFNTGSSDFTTLIGHFVTDALGTEDNNGFSTNLFNQTHDANTSINVEFQGFVGNDEVSYKITESTPGQADVVTDLLYNYRTNQ